jgi:hypothetical protein
MKLVIATITLFLSGVTSFVPSTPTLVGRGVASAAADAAAAIKTTALFVKPEEEEGGLDLDLSEMFDMCVSMMFEVSGILCR